MIYIDNSSTTKQAPEVTKLMANAAEESFGNPSSLHDLGIVSEKNLEIARKHFADAIGARTEEVFFNSGGTEGDNTVFLGMIRAGRHGKHNVVTTQVEHPAIMESCKILEEFGIEVRYLPVDRFCRVNTQDIENAVDENTLLLSMMGVNNEAGTILPIREGAAIAHKKGALFHTDAVQAFGKIDLHNTDADFITVSGHKIHGPKGVGALYRKSGVRLQPLIVGGGQEDHFRAGTENVPGIMGFGEAVRLSQQDFINVQHQMKAVRNHLLEELKRSVPDILVNSPDTTEQDEPGSGVSSVLNISFLGTRGEVLLHTLEQDQIYVSTGSACSSNKKGQSHVLTAMGLTPKEIEGAIRFSFSRYNTIEQMDFVAERVEFAVKKFRKLGSFR